MVYHIPIIIVPSHNLDHIQEIVENDQEIKQLSAAHKNNTYTTYALKNTQNAD